MNNIVLIGMPGTGKSVVGQALASRLGYEFVDVDDLIVERAGKTLPEILRQDGLEAFYKIEGQVGCDLNRQHTVIATGGSMVLYPEAMAHLKEGSVVVWLQTLSPRFRSGCPPTSMTVGLPPPKGESLREIYEDRRDLYAKYADLIVASRDGEDDTAHLVEEVMRTLAYRRDAAAERFRTNPTALLPFAPLPIFCSGLPFLPNLTIFASIFWQQS